MTTRLPLAGPKFRGAHPHLWGRLAAEGITEVVGKQPRSPTDLNSPKSRIPTAVTGYFLSAIGGGSGYVTLTATLNSISEGESADARFLRMKKLYRGEPAPRRRQLPEMSPATHCDFAARPTTTNLEWRKAPRRWPLHLSLFTVTGANATSPISIFSVTVSPDVLLRPK
jgi:hypothetical protein